MTSPRPEIAANNPSENSNPSGNTAQLDVGIDAENASHELQADTFFAGYDPANATMTTPQYQDVFMQASRTGWPEDNCFSDFFDSMMGTATPLPSRAFHDFEDRPNESLAFPGLLGTELAARKHPQVTSNNEVLRPSATGTTTNVADLNSVSDQAGCLPSRGGLQSRLPHILPIPQRRNHPLIVFSETDRSALLSDLGTRVSHQNIHNFSLPSIQKLQLYLRAFSECFDSHLSVIHLPSLRASQTPSPLILAMCAIGALYRLERKDAAALHRLAGQSLERDVEETPHGHAVATPDSLDAWSMLQDNDQSSEQRTLWESCTHFLLTFFAVFGGKPGEVQKAIGALSLLSADYRSWIYRVTPRLGERRDLNWQEWIERESIKRLLCGMLILGDLITTAYGTCPCFSILQDGDVEIPDDENLWGAASAEEWQTFTTLLPDAPVKPSLKDAVGRLMYNEDVLNGPDPIWSWSPFTATVIMHAVSIQLWYDMQCAQSQGFPLQSLVYGQIEAALNRCQELVTLARLDDNTACAQSETHMFNYIALLRVAHTRVFTGMGCADLKYLLWMPWSDASSVIRKFVATKVPSPTETLVNKAASHALEGILLPFEIGPLIVQKTAALTWSIEHAMANWDATLFAVKRTAEIQRLSSQSQSNDQETNFLDSVRSFLTDSAGVEVTSKTCLAAELLRVRARFFDDTWVWKGNHYPQGTPEHVLVLAISCQSRGSG
ncbi:hypothetical protein LTS15_002442 [Exophiala xenobiotica]|nr:hypothetical protein LTS15_002442 [Exophiala xenobiotica]